jgi:hypothetical protein
LKITVGFSTSDAWVSRFIRWFTGSKVSHAFLTCDYEMPGHPVLVLGAESNGYVMIPRDEFLRTNTVVAELVPAGDLVRGWETALAWLNQPYDYEGIIGVGLSIIADWIHRKLKSPLQSPRHLFCSEAVVRALQAAGTPEALDLDPASTSPDALLKALTATHV